MMKKVDLTGKEEDKKWSDDLKERKFEEVVSYVPEMPSSTCCLEESGSGNLCMWKPLDVKDLWEVEGLGSGRPCMWKAL